MFSKQVSQSKQDYNERVNIWFSITKDANNIYKQIQQWISSLNKLNHKQLMSLWCLYYWLVAQAANHSYVLSQLWMISDSPSQFIPSTSFYIPWKYQTTGLILTNWKYHKTRSFLPFFRRYIKRPLAWHEFTKLV